MTKPAHPSPDVLIAARDGARIAGMLPTLEGELAGMAKALDNRTFSAIQAGTLTPEMAQSAWMERFALHKLHRRFQTMVWMGSGVEIPR